MALRRKLPAIVAPDAIVGTIAAYFVRKYGLSRDCRVAAGSGDNPQSKVPVTSDLLSLGSSFVNMVSTDGQTLDMSGAACAMYDGIGRPFMFGCRTNGALRWDAVRALYGLRRDDCAPAEDVWCSPRPEPSRPCVRPLRTGPHGRQDESRHLPTNAPRERARRDRPAHPREPVGYRLGRWQIGPMDHEPRRRT